MSRVNSKDMPGVVVAVAVFWEKANVEDLGWKC